MIRPANTIQLYNLASFFERLEEHAQNAASFFDNTFLRILGESFGFSDMAISIYDQFHYIGGFSYGSRAERFHQLYQDKAFYQHDFVAKYITANFNQIAARPENITLKGSDILTGNDMAQSEYVEFLNDVGLRYLAVLPINETYRLSIYKDESQKDFSESEIDLLSCLLPIIRKRYKTFRQMIWQKRNSEIKSDLLNKLACGFIILDEKKQVLDYNTEAIQYLYELTGISYVNSAVHLLLDEIKKQPDHVRKHYQVVLENYSETNDRGLHDKYCCIRICPAESESLPVSSLFAALSTRELEVVDAFSRGLDYREISRKLFINECTIRTHLRNIYQKLGISNQRKLIFEYTKYCIASGRA